MKHTPFLIFLLLMISETVYTQWEHLPGPYGSGYIAQDAFFREGDTIFISLTGSIYKSFNEGHHWSFMPVNLPLDYNIQSILYKKDNLVFIEVENYYTHYSIF